jgi:hypothetical protein
MKGFAIAEPSRIVCLVRSDNPPIIELVPLDCLEPVEAPRPD